MLAFIHYLNVMTEVHPECLAELNFYLSFVVKMGIQFPPPLFYQHHKNFSHKAAAILSTQDRKINLSIRDDDLYFQIFAGRRAGTYDKRSSVDHSTNFCSSIFHGDIKNDVTAMSMNDSRSQVIILKPYAPINIDHLENELQFHINHSFVEYLLSDLCTGFDTGIQELPNGAFQGQNMRSGRKFPVVVVTKLIQEEVDNGFLFEPFNSSPFPIFLLSLLEL
ncbi:unnamed protein product [Rotaria socialis]|uniref:Uncharacterized protein n=1 Tax=Rotaria socialis TaxID=392032 RepID=A0A817VVV3_9BILA|nr:unnamed protein product [Rotaria socialis]CAF3342276.1 unnamed protein product [Rotaria socialis]CAF3348933.1 unnamed protein product [Rotaria socialis]CAF3350278.1 unnamed protein product [Rotaria socialis]CAF4325360.1 unnamed protein product [Rotaria socialis]